MNAKDYDYLVRFPSDFQLSVPTDATRRQPPRMYEAVPVVERDRGEPKRPPTKED